MEMVAMAMCSEVQEWFHVFLRCWGGLLPVILSVRVKVFGVTVVRHLRDYGRLKFESGKCVNDQRVCSSATTFDFTLLMINNLDLQCG